MYKNKATISEDPRFSLRRVLRKHPSWVLTGIVTGIFLISAVVYLFASGTGLPGRASLAGGDPGASPVRIVKMHTTLKGIYQLRTEDLHNAGFVTDINLESLHLLNQGVEVPYWIDGVGRDQRLTFYAWKNESLYIDGNIYWLVQGEIPDALTAVNPQESNDATIQMEQPELSEIPEGAYAYRLVIEENSQYFPQATEGDHWFAFTLSAPGIREVTFDASDVAAEESTLAVIRLIVWASSEAPADPDHHWRVSLNGNSIAEEQWDGRGLHVIESRFPARFVLEGENLLELESPAGENFRVDVVNLDRIEVVYPRYADSNQENVAFVSSANVSEVDGFSPGLRVFDVTERDKPELLGSVSGDGRLPAGVAPKMNLLISGEGDLVDPAMITPVRDLTSLRDPAVGAEYIVVAPAEFISSLEPLLEYRATEGRTTFAAVLEDIFNQFNYGIPDPIAVSRFLAQLEDSGETQPQYLLLVGDATYDPRGYTTTQEANKLPSFLVQTVYGGQTATDVGFVQLNEDDWPDLAVGRVPARESEEVETFVQKTLAYETAMKEGGNSVDVFAIADGQDPLFKSDAQDFLDLFPGDFQTDLFAPQAGENSGASVIREGFQSGAGIIAYFGHGSLSTWGKDRLFGVEDVSELGVVSGRAPIVLNLTCLTGLFTHPTNQSLAEALLFAPENRGAVAVLAPSSLTLPTDQSFLSQPFIDSMLTDPDLRLGDAHLVARRQVPLDSPTSRDVMYTFMLFGDPALTIELSNR